MAGRVSPAVDKSVKAAPTVTKAKGVDSRNAPGSNLSFKPAAPKAAPKVTPKPAPKPAPKPVAKKPATKATPYKPQDLTLDVNGQLQSNALESEYDTQSALRQYQESAARRDLQTNLSTLDRDALEAYKTVADDYAGRGMLRSGGYAAADDKVYKNVTNEKNRMNNQLNDLLKNNQLLNAGEFEQLGYNKQNILNAYLTSLMANKTKKIGAV
jgi:hypothetical protein